MVCKNWRQRRILQTNFYKTTNFTKTFVNFLEKIRLGNFVWEIRCFAWENSFGKNFGKKKKFVWKKFVWKKKFGKKKFEKIWKKEKIRLGKIRLEKIRLEKIRLEKI